MSSSQSSNPNSTNLNIMNINSINSKAIFSAASSAASAAAKSLKKGKITSKNAYMLIYARRSRPFLKDLQPPLPVYQMVTDFNAKFQEDVCFSFCFFYLYFCKVKLESINSNSIIILMISSFQNISIND
jgi:hypothetical protein